MSSARILVIDDDPAIRKIIADRMRAAGHEVSTAADGQEGVETMERVNPDLVLVDMRMPRLDGFGVLGAARRRSEPPDVVMITAHGKIDLAVRAVREGAADFIAKPFDAAHLEHVVRRVLDAAGLRRRVAELETEISARHTLVEPRSPAMKRALEIVRRAAGTDSTVLLLGESGTGKEVLARYLHASSPRSSGPFAAVNCAVLTGNLLESELFGHEKGAFTGAHKTKQGRLELATGGTLFLDEIGELETAVQAKLLRVLQERQFERVGGTRTLEADIRVVAATHRDLRKDAEEGRFREDLFYRLNVVSIRVPPLRERTEDLDSLIDHALARANRETGRRVRGIESAARKLLQAYPWPGNVRELQNVLERAVVLAPEESIALDDLPEEIVEQAADLRADPPAGSSPPGPVDEGPDAPVLIYRDAVVRAKRDIIVNALKRTGGHQTRAAKLLGVSQPYLARLIKNLQVPKIESSAPPDAKI